MDEFLARGDVQEIVAKRFPHKRAFEVDGVMVELFLVQADEAGTSYRRNCKAGDPASGRTRSWPRIDLVEAELVAFDVLHVEAGLVFLVGDEELAADCAEGE